MTANTVPGTGTLNAHSFSLVSSLVSSSLTNEVRSSLFRSVQASVLSSFVSRPGPAPQIFPSAHVGGAGSDSRRSRRRKRNPKVVQHEYQPINVDSAVARDRLLNAWELSSDRSLI
eukprot:3939528-Rhodomonas_salina.1